MFHTEIAKCAAISGLFLAVTACASTAPANDGPPEGFAKDVRLGEEVDRICFASNIDSFEQTDRRTVVVEEGNDHYLIEVFGSCHNLRVAQSLAIDTTGSCLRRGDALLVSDSAFGFNKRDAHTTSRCTISRIYDWDPKAEVPEDDV